MKGNFTPKKNEIIWKKGESLWMLGDQKWWISNTNPKFIHPSPFFQIPGLYSTAYLVFNIAYLQIFQTLNVPKWITHGTQIWRWEVLLLLFTVAPKPYPNSPPIKPHNLWCGPGYFSTSFFSLLLSPAKPLRYNLHRCWWLWHLSYSLLVPILLST